MPRIVAVIGFAPEPIESGTVYDEPKQTAAIVLCIVALHLCGLLYMDGISESNNPDGVEFGVDRFRQVLAEMAGSANQVADDLLGELARWSARNDGEDLDDDITLVAFRMV